MSVLNSFHDSQIEFHYTISENPKQENFKMHTHPTCEMYYFIHGNGIFHVEGNNYHLKSGDLLVMRPFEAHYIEINPDTPYERIAANVSVGYFDFCDPDRNLLKPFFERKQGQFNLYRSDNFSSDLYVRILERLKQKRNISKAMITGCVLSLLNEISLADNKNTETINNRSDVYKIIQYINRNIDSSLSLSGLCDKFYISKSVLCKKFKIATGSSVSDYITTKKIIKAQSLIESGTNITEAAHICGYTEYSTFYRAYKKVFNCSPNSVK